MNYLLFDQNAISTFVSASSLQSVEYAQGERLVQHILGKLSSEIFEGVAIHYSKDGVIFCGRKHSTVADHRIYCIDLTACNILSEESRPSDLLTVIQKSFRTTIKIWNRQPFSFSERVHGSKSIIFPFVMSDHRRIVIERSNSVLRLEKRGIDFPLLAYKYNAEDPPSGEDVVDTKILQQAGEEFVSVYNTLQTSLAQTAISGSQHEDTSALAYTTATTTVGRDDFVYWDYNRQLSQLTKTQQQVVEYDSLSTPLRVDGAAGTGKTISLILRAYRLLKQHREEGRPFRVVFFAHSTSTSFRNREIFNLYPESSYFLDSLSPQNICFTTLLDYCRDIAGFSPDVIIEKDANDAKTYQLMLIENVVTTAESTHKVKTYRSLISQGLRDIFDSTKTAPRVLYAMLQHEFSVQIKGRTDGTIYTYYDIPPIPNGLPCETKKDKEFVFSLFNDYQNNLNSMGSYDVDDVVMEALSHLNAPIWRRERSQHGYDYIFADEMHLFNVNEQSVFHFLTKNLSQKNIPICFALDYSQAIGDRGDIRTDYIEKAFGKTVETKYNTVFRNSPLIAEFCASVAASGTLMFQESFSNPYTRMQTNFTSQEEEKCLMPTLHMYNNDEEMICSLSQHLGYIQKSLQCKMCDIAVISFDSSLTSTEGLQKLKDMTNKDFVLLEGQRDHTRNGYILTSPYMVNGLEFKAVILLGVDEGRLPQTAGTSDISQHFIKYSAYNLLYLSSSRAKYSLIMLGSKLNGRSSCLEHSINSGHLKQVEC